MAKLLLPYPGRGQLVKGPRPYTAPAMITLSSTRRRTGWGSRPHTDKVQGRQLTLGQKGTPIHNRLANIQSAFTAADTNGTGFVSKEAFRRVLESQPCFSQDQLSTMLSQVCERSGEAVDYMQFLRSFRPAPMAQRASSSSSSVRCGPQDAAMSLSEIQRQLKEKIGGNLRNVIRVFRLFDCSGEGHIEQHEFRRILDRYCMHLTDSEFKRLWSFCCPSNTRTVSYELFLEKLGFGAGHDFNIAPVCTKIEVSSRGTSPPEKVKQRKPSPEALSSSCDAPSELPTRELHTLFHSKMCVNSTPVWQALQAFDTTHSGLVKQGVLRAVLSSFIFPMNPHTFQKLTSCYGVRATGPVRWKHFLGHFVSPSKEEGDADPPPSRALPQPAQDKESLHFKDIYPQLKDIFHLLDTREEGLITRAALRHLLKRPCGTHPQTPRLHLQHSQITELLNTLDPEHTGVIQLASLERLDPNNTSAPQGDEDPPASPADTAELRGVLDQTEDIAEQQKSPAEGQATPCTDKVSVASSSWRTVDHVLVDRLCERPRSVLAALKMCDPQHTGYVTQDDLKKVLSCYGVPISDTHLIKLCEMSSCRPEDSSELVYYTGFLRNLGVPLPDETNRCASAKESHHIERPCRSLQSSRGRRSSSAMRASPDTCSILDIVFRWMKLRLEQCHSSLSERIRAVTHSSDGTMSEGDVRKVLEDSWVILDQEHFNKFTDLLGFRDGQIECSAFLAMYEEATARDKWRGSEGHRGDKDELHSPLTRAEQCLAAMKTRIRSIHGDNLTAFRLMDRKHRGMVDCQAFKWLCNSLGFSCTDEEYQRLLDLIGLSPRGNLAYAEFVDIVENNGKRKQGTRAAIVREQLHELLSRDARHKWADMSKVLCQFDTDGQGWIHKKSLRELLFTYALPLRSDEFDQLWVRYDPEQRGRVAVCDFLQELGFHPGELKARSHNQTNAKQKAARAVSSDAASLECLEQTLQENYQGLSSSLTHLEKRGDGTVTVEQLLRLLDSYSCSIQREQLVNHLRSLKISMDENNNRLAYMDFLSAFERKPEKNEPPPATPDALHQIESLDSLSPDMALAKLQELVTASAANLHKTFSAFDQSGTGTVKALEFRQVLDHFCARLSDKQYQYMLSKLQLDIKNCSVNWKDFLNKFQSQSPQISADRRPSTSGLSSKARPRLSKTPEIKEQQIQDVVSGHLFELNKEMADLDPSSSATLPKEQFRQLCDRTNDQVTSRRSASVGRPGTGSLLGSTERRLRGEVHRRWKEIQRSCTERDPQQQGHVSTTDFLEVLQSLRISITREQFEHLTMKFDILNDGRVSYHNFLRHFLLNLKPVKGQRPLLRRKLPPPITETKGVLSSDCVDVMLRIYKVIHSSWTSIRRCFLACDRSRSGIVSIQDFRKVLRQFSVDLSQEEFFHLSSYFDGDATGKIYYNNFLGAFLH